MITISDEVRRHLATHFRPGIPGSKFYCHSPEVLLGRAMELFPELFREATPDKDGRIRLSLRFPEAIGVSNVVDIDELTTKERKSMRTVERQGRKVRLAMTDRTFPTRECQIILTSDWQLVTMFPGEPAPPLPPSPDTHDEYWDRHVFVEPVRKELLQKRRND